MQRNICNVFIQGCVTRYLPAVNFSLALPLALHISINRKQKGRRLSGKVLVGGNEHRAPCKLILQAAWQLWGNTGSPVSQRETQLSAVSHRNVLVQRLRYIFFKKTLIRIAADAPSCCQDVLWPGVLALCKVNPSVAELIETPGKKKHQDMRVSKVNTDWRILVAMAWAVQSQNTNGSCIMNTIGIRILLRLRAESDIVAALDNVNTQSAMLTRS